MQPEFFKQKFADIFKVNPAEAELFFSPGRANLIGEHTDYNGGNVFPCALSFGTYLLAKKRNDGKINFYSLNFEKDGLISTDIKSIEKTNNWTDYPKGVIKAITEKGGIIDSGFDALYYGDIPNGAGLSSSASIEVVTAFMLNKFFALGYDKVTLALLSQRAENKFVGVSSGIMDQFAVAMGKQDNAILLDTNTLKYKYVPVVLEGISILIANTNKRRELAGSKYNERRGECEAALEALKTKLDIKTLCDIDFKKLEENKGLIKEEVLYRRARHAITENDRTLKAVPLLISGDIKAFGKLMDASHKSLKEDYEVTGIELDTIVEALQKQKGVLGARMMGAGFGGCAIALVENKYIDSVKEAAAKEYSQKTPLKADFYIAAIGEGVREI